MLWQLCPCLADGLHSGLAVATGWIPCLWDVFNLNVMCHVSAGMMNDRSRLCEGAEALEQQLRLLGTERLTVADEIRKNA